MAEPTDPAAPRRERPYDQRSLRRPDSLVVVNTGHGKGKSSAAFGTVLRAVALEWPTAVVQFQKSGKWHTGEEKVCRRLGVDWFSAGDGFSWDSRDLDESRAKAVAAWEFSEQLISAGDHRLVVLDEISYSMTWGWIDADLVSTAVRERPRHVNLVLTGRDMETAVIDAADTVTEMVKLKHAFDDGLRALRGIDF